MPERRVHIDRIDLRLRGVSERTAREAADGLAGAIVQSVSESGGAGPRHHPSLDLGTVPAPRSMTGARIAEEVGCVLGKRLSERR